MNKKIVYTKVTRKVNGQPVHAEPLAPNFPDSPETLTRKIAAANQFDSEALESNRAERLTSSQFVQACKAMLFNLFFFASLIVLMIGATLGFLSLSNHDYPQALLPCLGAVVMLFVAGLIYTKRTGLGIERYGAGESVLTLLRRFLLPFDLILGRVTMLEGNAEKDKSVYTMAAGPRSRGSIRDEPDYSATAVKRYSYFYRIGDVGFTATEEGYNVFPDYPQKCRIYYLPLSRVMVNVKAL